VQITTQVTALTEDDKITLEADGLDPDGDILEYKWYLIRASSEKLLGTGESLPTKLPAGTLSIEVEVDDGKGGKFSDTMTIKVQAVEEGSNLGLILGIVAVIVIVVIVALAMMMMRKKPAVAMEKSMDLDSLQKDYDPTPDGGGGEAPGYDPTPSDWDEYKQLE
jgi:hypothetical protein